MPAINFKAEYAAKILDGSKPFTLRKRRSDYRDPAPICSHLGLFTGMRTKAVEKFATATSAMRATLAFNHRAVVLFEHVSMAASDGGGHVGGRSRASLLEEVRTTIHHAHHYPNGPETQKRLELIASWDGFASWADMWAFHEAYGVNADGVAVRELIGFGNVMPVRAE